MSETELDGSDPRVLAPSEDEPDVIVKAAFGGAGKAYHTTECVNVDSMRQTREVKLSVAEWKGYHECRQCIQDKNSDGPIDRDEQNATDDPRGDMPTLDECETFRMKIGGDGLSLAETASESDWGRTAVSTHAQGKCDHETSINPVAHGWYFDPEREDTPGMRDEINDNVSETTCQKLRLALVKGGSLTEVADKFNLSDDGVRYHALGRCAHEPRIDAVSHGWHFE